ncbi:MAG: aldehyde ferredoxin oxidoreductase N-terminal domain-containing protein [Bacteroidales bacterium]|jgi:glyceraldehyde-3-phosphate dehydrogenase (ferredoxin)|nr:aldehyde ferredoxin oxidoreductase N-terminal domain-containing protein [Bacteroidales bacterium]MDD4234525.1 aldehyde ferredoxin oxidoreductase N-terminal domain-containing protein [Bacteroidales bacterium]MDY0160672.1 aldehyde ferredoxin oxidoreductase N-terminal domain-containing protein [Bacteroidales bacterium]
MLKSELKTLMIDTSSGFYKLLHYNIGKFWGPVDLGLHLAHKNNSLNIGTGLLSGSIFPGSNRMVFTGISPSWHGFYISSMGGAGLVFDNLGINLLSLVGKATTPSILYLNRIHGEEIQVDIKPVNIHEVWEKGRGGVYSMMQHAYDEYGDRYEEEPRILAVGQASLFSDIGAICSAPVKKGVISFVDTWAGRGGLGTKLLMEHGIAAVIYGGTFVDEDFRDRKVADKWFEDRYKKKLMAKDLEATTKYRFDPNFNTGGTFGVNYANLGTYITAFNYRTIYWSDEKRQQLHTDFILNHYLKQFNEETILPKQQKNCGEPCVAVCKKMRDEFKKDYEPYQTLGPLCGIFDQRAAEKLNGKADSMGFDAISIGGVLAWLMECMHEDLIKPEEIGINKKPIFEPENFDIVKDSMHNANIGVALLEEIAKEDSKINLKLGARKYARAFAKCKTKKIMDLFIYTAFARQGWMVPNQYWTPGVLSPMGIMGKYYNDYGRKFIPPRELGQINAERMKKELILDNLGICRFHRAWAEDIMPDIVQELFGDKKSFLQSIDLAASRINSRNSSVFWETERNIDYVFEFLKKKQNEGETDPELLEWIKRFEKDKHSAAYDYWYDIHKGIHECLRDFPV